MELGKSWGVSWGISIPQRLQMYLLGIAHAMELIELVIEVGLAKTWSLYRRRNYVNLL